MTDHWFGALLQASLKNWTKLSNFEVNSNQLSGAVLPALPFRTMESCYLLNYPILEKNTFQCPWPAGATAKCLKFAGTANGTLTWQPITDADCTPQPGSHQAILAKWPTGA